MKKNVQATLRAALAAALVLSIMLTGCSSGSSSSSSSSSGSSGSSSSSSSEATDSSDSESKGRIAYIVGNLGDKSFSDSGEAGMNTLRSEGWEVKTVETGDASKADKYEDYIRDVLDQGYEYVVASSTYLDILIDLADEYPDAYFLGFDDIRDDLPDNVGCIFYAQNEGSYLVGILAAGMTETGVVGVDVGIENPVISDFVTGFVQGVKDTDPSVSVVEAACGSWSDPATMKTLVLDQQRNNNADVFYQVAGGSGDGLFEACLETGTWAIGVDSDQYAAYIDSENPEKADVILTSMLKEVGNSFISFFHDVENGTAVWGETITLGLAQDSVGYVDNDYFREQVPADVVSAMEDAAAKVKSGELEVPSYYDFADESEYLAFLEAAK